MGMATHYPEDYPPRTKLLKRFESPTGWDAFVHFLKRAAFVVPDAVLKRVVTQPIEASEAMQACLMQVYRNDASLASLCERMVDLDEGIQEWRYRHVKMVERTIGTKRGTGGSEGAEYLKTTLMRPLFPDLWAIRTSF
jgi:tryptophan 2,3-dioxygenase